MIKFEFKLSQKAVPPSAKQVDAKQQWIVVLPEFSTSSKTDSQSFPYLETLRSRRARVTRDAADTEPHVTDLPNVRGSRVAYVCIKPDMKSFDLLTLARKLVAVHKPGEVDSISLYVGNFDKADKPRIAETIVAAAAAVNVSMPNFRRSKAPQKQLTHLEIYGVIQSDGYRRTLAEAEGNALARYLSILPPNKLTPTEYLKQIKLLAREHNWKLEFFDIAALKKKKAGAFLAVVQGSPVHDAGIVRLRYIPARVTSKRKLSLVGKGVCYDTGGTNLKPAKSMFGMHEDMQGSAVALGVFLALSRLQVNYPVECWLALAMNHIGPKSYKPNDVVVAADGTTIEVVHTDAEGRMVLADTLVFASEQKPTLIIDYATLTGACVYSLGTAYSGVFTNREQLWPALIQSGQTSGERVWPFPLDEDYDNALKSGIADVKQCAQEGNADHILGARFLQRFVKHDPAWIHVDLSSSTNKGGLAHIPTDTTGFGVRYTLNLLSNSNI